MIGTLSADLELTPLLVGNTLSAESRSSLLLALFTGLFAGAAFGGLALALRREGILVLSLLSRLLSPLAVAMLVPSLLNNQAWHNQALAFLLQLTIVAAYLTWSLHLSMKAAIALGQDQLDALVKRYPRALANWLPLSCVIVATLGYVAYFSYFTILNHRQLATTGYDLGIIVSWAHNGLFWDFDRCTVLYPNGQSCFSGHAIYAMVLWLPFYMIAPGAEPLLIFQAMMLGGAALPLYAFARTLLSQSTSMWVALAYLLFPALHGPNFYDFHGLPLILPFQFWLYYAISARKPWQIAVALLFLFAHREDVAVGITVLGLFLTLTGVRPRLGLLLAGVACSWFVVNKFMIMPALGENTWFANIYKELQPAGEATYGGVVKTILSNPAYSLTTVLREVKLAYVLHMLAPVAFLPLRRPALWMLLLPGFFFTVMTTGYAPTISISFQYTTHWISYVFLATVIGLHLITDGMRRKAAVGALIVATFFHSYCFGAVLQRETFVGGFQRINFEFTEDEQRRYRDLQTLLAQIPAEASVAATEDLIPHAASRKDSYTLRTHFEHADYFLIRKHGLNFSGTRNVLKRALSVAHYGLVDQRGDLYLFQRDHDDPRTRATWRSLGFPRVKPLKR